MSVDIYSFLVQLFAYSVAAFAVGYVLSYLRYDNPIYKVLREAGRKDLALALVLYEDGVAVFKTVRKDGKHLLDERGKMMWQLVGEENDKPPMLRVGATSVPLFLLHESSAVAPVNPSVLADGSKLVQAQLVKIEKLKGSISARELHILKSYAELMGRIGERNKIRDAIYYLIIMVGIAIIIIAVQPIIRGLFG